MIPISTAGSLSVNDCMIQHLHDDLTSGRLSPSEAAAMDPKGRLLLEQTGLALNDATARQDTPVASAAGVYVGVMHMEYIQFMDSARPALP